MREIILPAYRLLHPDNESSNQRQIADPLTVPSAAYDALRATLVQAELTLLRVLGFDLRIPLPIKYLPRYLERAMRALVDTGEDYDTWGKEEKEEYGVVTDAMDTCLGRACRSKCIMA